MGNIKSLHMLKVAISYDYTTTINLIYYCLAINQWQNLYVNYIVWYGIHKFNPAIEPETWEETNCMFDILCQHWSIFNSLLWAIKLSHFSHAHSNQRIEVRREIECVYRFETHCGSNISNECGDFNVPNPICTYIMWFHIIHQSLYININHKLTQQLKH